MKETHSSVGGSGASRWLMCPGSVRMAEFADNEDTDSKFSLEGTAAHNLADECIERKVSPYTYINGGTITVDKSDGSQIEWPVDADMAGAVMVYLQRINEIYKATGAAVHSETSFHMTWIDDQLWGRNDYKSFAPFDTLYVYDYKHGAGVGVDVEYAEAKTYFCGGTSKYNPQLMYYALGALGPNNDYNIANVQIGIVQPRKPHHDGPVRSVDIPLTEVYRWRDEVLIPGLAATREENAPCIPGEWCQFCDAIAHCPAASERVRSVTKQSAAEVFAPAPAFPALADMTPEQKAALLKYSGLLKKWIEKTSTAIKAEVLNGTKNPELKVVNGNAQRAWTSPEQAEQYFAMYLGEDAYTPRDLKSPAQMEKALEAKGFKKDVVDQLITKTRGRNVVPVSDKRPPIVIESAAEVFSTQGVDAPAKR